MAFYLVCPLFALISIHSRLFGVLALKLPQKIPKNRLFSLIKVMLLQNEAILGFFEVILMQILQINDYV